MRIKFFKSAFFLLVFLITSFSAYSQFPYYIRLEESEIRSLLAKRKVDGLGVQYSNEGKKIMTWQDLGLRTGIVVIFDAVGKSESCTLIPFTARDLYEFKAVLTKEDQIVDNNEWLSTVENRKFKILMQYNPTYSKYCFTITEISALDQLIKSLHISTDRHKENH